jgi:hypothetical protein
MELLQELREHVSHVVWACNEHHNGRINMRQMNRVEDRFNRIYQEACLAYGSSSREITDAIAPLAELYG